jgi:hypothetical protein
MDHVAETSPGDPATSFETFDLSVHLGPHLVPWISASSRIGLVHGIPRGNSGLPPLNDLLDFVYDYTDAVYFAEREAAPEISRVLEQLVFGDPLVLELFQATRGAAADRGRQLLVRILASPHLAVLPWELLPDPAAWQLDQTRRFLALAADVHVARMARGRNYATRTDRLEPPLNLLVVLSSPSGRDPADDVLAFDIYEVKRNLLQELHPLEADGLLRVDVEDHPTLENLRRRIGAQRRGYHMLHYVGHALPDHLVLEDAAGRREDHQSANFADVFRLCPDLRLAVFAGCETARPPGDPMALDVAATVGWKDLLSLADKCVQEICPIVVGMQAVLPFRTERLFTRFFYQGVAAGYSVAEALRLARGAVHGDQRVGADLLDWSVPVLFVGGSDPGQLLGRPARGKPPERPVRHELKLGLRQGEVRFFARDIALRQAVDVLAGRTGERILVVTGPAGVGKSVLIDRALEELGDQASHVLYLRLEYLAPSLKETLDRVTPGERDWRSPMAKFDPDSPVARLCELVAELLGRSHPRRRSDGPSRRAGEWWARLIEELARCRFTLVIDNIELIDQLEQVYLARLMQIWLARQLQGRGDADDSPRRIARIRHSEKTSRLHPRATTKLAKQLEELLDFIRDQTLPAVTSTSQPNRFVAAMGSLEDFLSGMGRLRKAAEPEIAAAVEQVLDQLKLPVDRPELQPSSDLADESEVAALIADLQRIETARTNLGAALDSFCERRSQSRMAIITRELPAGFLKGPAEERFEMRLGHLTWLETWQWIRRNLPGLVSYGDVYLRRLWPRFGAELSRWEAMESRVVAVRDREVEIEKIAGEIVPPLVRRQPIARLPLRRQRGGRPLRVAVASGRYLVAESMTEAITLLALDHGVGGRVVPGGPSEEGGTLAVLIEERAPFRDAEGQRYFEEPTLLEWIGRLADRHQPDILLLDYFGWQEAAGFVMRENAERKLLRTLRRHTLLIALGAHVIPPPGKGRLGVLTPGVYPEVLSVGPLDDAGDLRPYAAWAPRLVTPDIFMPDNLVGTPLALALVDKAEDMSGPNYPALHAVAAAILVWAILPDLTPHGVESLLLEASRPIPGYPQPQPKSLLLRDAVALARQRVLERTLSLEGGPCSVQTLAAITGLDPRSVSDTLRDLGNRVVKLSGGRFDRYELVPQGASQPVGGA